MTWPFENDTSAITKKLANRSIKADKRRNIFIIVTIAFAACLMTVLALYTFGKSHELKTFLQGRYQAAVIDVDLETINDLRQDSNIEMVGTEALVDSFRVDDYTLNVNFRDSNNLYLYSTEFVGNLPDKENEVAVSEAYLKHIGRPVELNQEIELPLQNGKNANFTVCGLLHDDGANRRYQVLVSDSFLQSYFQDHIPYNATLRIMGSGSFKEDELKNLIKSCLTPYGIREEQIAYSSSYFDSVDNSSRDMLGVAAISILIVIACSTVIYSLFYISVVGKVKEYGRLRVIGMTQKQIKRMVKRESWQLSRTSIPLGIVVGCLIGYALLSSISQERINRELAQEYAAQIRVNEKRVAQTEGFKAKLYENLVSGILTKEEFLSYKRKYNTDIELFQKAIAEWNDKLTDVLENRSERNRWINHFMKFSTMEDIDRRAVMQLIRSIRVMGKDELHIEFNYQDEYQKAISLAEQIATKNEERMVG